MRLPDDRTGPAGNGTGSNVNNYDNRSIVPVVVSRRRPQFAVVYVNANMAVLKGHGAREEYIDLKGRPPVWSHISRGWVTTPRTASDLIAQWESRGLTVDVSEDDPLPTARGVLW